MIKQRKKPGTSREKRKRQTRKTGYTTWENKQEISDERRNIKKISRQYKTIQTKQDIPKQLKKNLPTSKGRWHKGKPITGCKGS